MSTDISPAPLAVDFREIDNYFQYISGKHYEKEIFTYCFLDEFSKEPIKGYGTRHGNLKELSVYIANIPGVFVPGAFTLHHTLNRTNLNGRKTKDIQAARVICVDLDKVLERTEIRAIAEAHRPGMVVQSSPGKYHLYWRIPSDIRMNLEVWQKTQLAFAEFFHDFGADKNLAQLSKTLRVPGVPRRTKDGSAYLPKIMYLDPKREFDAAEFPWISDMYARGKARIAQDIQTARASVKAHRTGKRLPKTEKLGRNHHIFLAVKYSIADLDNLELDLSHSLNLAQALNAEFPEPLSAEELERCVHSAHEKGLLTRAARERKRAKMQQLPVVLNGNHAHAQNGSNGHHALAVYAPFQYSYESPGLAHNRFSENSLSDRMIERFGSELCRVNEKVYAFQDGVWELQTAKYHANLDYMASTAILDIINDPQFVDTFCKTKDGEFSAALQMKAQMRFMSPRVLNGGIARVLQSKTLREVSPQTFDNKISCLLCDKQVIDASADVIAPRYPVAEDYLKAKTYVRWNPSAKCPGWIKFLSEVFEESQELICFMQELFGYSLSGHMSEQRIFCHQGDGCNGKSKVLYALHLLGGSYSITVPPDDLSKSKGMGKAFERFGAQIEGKRVAIIDDMDVKSVWNESLVKTLTSKTITSRHLYSELREIPNRAKLHLGLNVAPVPEAENYGIIRRLCFIPYNVQFEPSGRKEQELTQMIESEAEGILAWAIEGFKRYFERGCLVYPTACQIAQEEYQEENFPIQSLLTELFEFCPEPEKDENSEQSWENWYWMSDLIDEINSYIAANADRTAYKITAHALSDGLKRVFKVTSKKRFDKNRNSSFRGVFLIKKYDPKSLGKFDRFL